MVFREAHTGDIKQIQEVRNSVKENILSRPELVTDQDCFEFLSVRGKGWVCEVDHQIVGFAIVDLIENNVWALFVKPEYEKKGIGKVLQEMMLNWYFDQGEEYIWLGTSPHTRAEKFYRKSGWMENGTNGPAEIKFEMHKDQYQNRIQ
jgi:GNAT superfamily N-acetyltransferase